MNVLLRITGVPLAQMIAEKWDLSRAQLEAYSLESHRRALQAIEQGRFNREIVPLAGVLHDETPRQTSLEKMAELVPLIKQVAAQLSAELGAA